MANDLQESIQQIVNRVAQEGQKGIKNAKDSSGGLSGVKGIAAGAGIAALAPLAAKGIGKAVKSVGSDGLENFVSGLGDKLGGGEGNGPGGMVTDALKSALPFGGGGSGSGGGSGGSKGTVPGVGKGRRMPVQQSIDIGAPVETVYNQWTQYELWPSFMHRVTDVTQKDQCTVSFSTKIWGKKKEFVAKIETQRPDERVKWKVEQGITHTGVVTFHELGPRLTRVLLNLDVDPGGMLEKAARGLRHVKRAARADLHRFKAFIEVQEVETGAWRGVIENGKVVEEHDESYDKDREYSKFEDVFKGPTAKKKTASEQRSSSGGGRSSSGGGRSSSGGGRSSSGSGRSSSGSGRSSSGSGRSASGRGRSSRSSSNGNSSSSSSSRSSSSRSSSSRGRSSNHSEGRSRSTRRRS
jgi:uncharacterized membrane protein